MNSTSLAKPPVWFLIVSVLALLWNLMGVMAYFSQMTMDLDTLENAQREFYASMPLWATVAFTIAVFAGSIGSLGLILKKRWAHSLLVLSCLGIVAQMTHSLLVGNGLEVFGTAALILPVATLAIGLALIGLAIFAKNKGWLH